MDFGSPVITARGTAAPGNDANVTGREAAESLRRAVRQITGDLGGKFFREVVPFLEREAENARSDYLRRMAEEAAGFVRIRRSAMESELLLNVARSVQNRTSDPLDVDELTAALFDVGSGSHEDSDALDSFATQVEIECAALLNDLQGRFEMLRGQSGERMPDVTPQAFLEAFRSALGENDLERGSRMLLYTAFSRIFLQGLRSYYVSMLESLNRFGVGSSQDISTSVLAMGTGSSMAEIEPWMEPGRGDGMLAIELASSVAGCSKAMQGEIARRAAMVGTLFDGLARGLSVPHAIGSLVGGLRPLVVRAAVPARDFFASKEHPLRSTLDRIAIQAGLVTLDPNSARPLFDELLGQLRRSCADTATSSFAKIGEPLSATELDRFKADLVQQGLARSIEFQRKARFWSGRMLFNLASAARLNDEITQLLWKTWHIPVAAVLKSHGREGAHWKQIVELTDRLLFVVAKTPQAFDSLNSDLAATLRDCGVPEQELIEWMSDMKKALENFPPSPVTSIPSLLNVAGGIQTGVRLPAARNTISDLLDPYLKVDTWYQLYDPQVGRRWKKVNSYYKEQASLSFVDIDGSNPISLNYADLLSQIAAGKSLPFTMPAEDLTSLIRMIGS